MKHLTIIAIALAVAPLGWGNQRVQGFCEQGGKAVVTSGLNSVTKVQASYPACTISVYLTGTLSLATLYSDNSATPMANPFTADSFGHWFWYAANGRYDVRLSGGGLPAPWTIGDILLADPTGFGTSVNSVTAGVGITASPSTGAVTVTNNWGAVPTGSQTQQLRIKPNTGNSSTYEFFSALPPLNSTDYIFTPQSPGGTLSVGANTITMVPVPLGVNGSDIGHPLYVSVTGTPESCTISGGSGSAGDASGQIIITCAHTHSAGWSIQTATSGIAEAVASLNGTKGTVQVGPGLTQTWHATATIPTGVTLRISAGTTISSSVMPMVHLSGDYARLVGDFPTLVPTASSGAVVTVSSISGQVQYPEVSGIKINGAATTGTVDGVDVRAGWHPAILNNDIQGVSGSGVKLEDVDGGGGTGGTFFADVRQNHITGNSGAGIYGQTTVGGSITMSKFALNWLHSNGTCMTLNGTGGSLFWTELDQNDCEATTGDAIKLINALSVWFKSGVVEGAGGWCINPDSTSNGLKVEDTVLLYGCSSGGIKPNAASSTTYTMRDSNTFAQTNIQPQGWALQHHVGLYGSSNTYEVGNNCKPLSAAQCNLDDTGLEGWVMRLQNDGGWRLFHVTAGTNPRTLVELLTVDAAGVSMPNLPSTAPGAGSKRLWYDPADSNRIKIVP